jgi:hypothetical protein
MFRGCWLALLAVLGGCSFQVEPVALSFGGDDLAAPDLATTTTSDFAARLDLTTLPDLSARGGDLAAPDLATTGTPILMVTRATSPATVNLTTEGVLDWEAYGLNMATDVNRKMGVPQKISHSSVGNLAQFAFFGTMISWSDGMPTASVNNSRSGAYITGVDNGFTWVVPASTTQRTLRLYVGEFRGTGTLVAHLSDGSIADVITTDKNTNGITLSQFTIVFRATTDGTLTVSWHLTVDNTGGASDFLAATYF